MLVVTASLADIAVRLLEPVGTLLAVPFKMIWSLFKWSAPLLGAVEPLAIGAVAACTAAMLATITLVLGRDLRRAQPLMIREDL